MIFSYLDILDRAKTGPQVKKNDWDLEHVVIPTKQIVRKYDLTWDKQSVVPNDPDLADRVFQAALELAEETGV